MRFSQNWTRSASLVGREAEAAATASVRKEMREVLRKCMVVLEDSFLFENLKMAFKAEVK